jgi:hypothetical protein
VKYPKKRIKISDLVYISCMKAMHTITVTSPKFRDSLIANRITDDVVKIIQNSYRRRVR